MAILTLYCTYFVRKDWDKLIVWTDAYLKINSKDAWAYCYKSIAQYHEDMYFESQVNFKKAILLDPNMSNYTLVKCNPLLIQDIEEYILYSLGRYEEDRIYRLYCKIAAKNLINPSSYKIEHMRIEMKNNNKRKTFYDFMINQGLELPQYETFTAFVLNPTLNTDQSKRAYNWQKQNNILCNQ